MFSILVLLAFLATALVVSAHIRIGGFFLLLYWIWVGIIIFIGPGRAPESAVSVVDVFVRILGRVLLNMMVRLNITGIYHGIYLACMDCSRLLDSVRSGYILLQMSTASVSLLHMRLSPQQIICGNESEIEMQSAPSQEMNRMLES